MNVSHTGKIAPGTGDHIIRHMILAVTHEFFHRHHEGVVDGHIFAVQRLHPRLFGVVPGDFSGGNRYDVPGLGQRHAESAVVRGNAQCQRTAGGETAGAHISAAVLTNHLPVAFVGHIVGFGDAMLRTERIKWEPYVAAAVAGQFAHHGQIAPVRADDHAAAEEVENGPGCRFRIIPNDQAGEALYLNGLIVRFVISGNKNAPVAVLLLDDLADLRFREGKSSLCTGEPVCAPQRRCEQTHCALPPSAFLPTPFRKPLLAFSSVSSSSS